MSRTAGPSEMATAVRFSSAGPQGAPPPRHRQDRAEDRQEPPRPRAAQPPLVGHVALPHLDRGEVPPGEPPGPEPPLCDEDAVTADELRQPPAGQQHPPPA